jgi:hypothetical protein
MIVHLLPELRTLKLVFETSTDAFESAIEAKDFDLGKS